MSIILRNRHHLPMMQPDGSFVDKEYGLIALVDETGQQYSQFNIEALEVEGFEIGESLAFTIGSPHSLTVPEDHGKAMLRTDVVTDILSE